MERANQEYKTTLPDRVVWRWALALFLAYAVDIFPVVAATMYYLDRDVSEILRFAGIWLPAAFVAALIAAMAMTALQDKDQERLERSLERARRATLYWNLAGLAYVLWKPQVQVVGGR